MYLSRLKPNLRSQKVRHHLRDAYEMHRTLSKASANYEDDRILWRQELGQGRNPQPIILVQSQQQPDWGYLYESVPPRYLLEDAEVKEIDIGFYEGQVLHFRLCANPTAIKTFDNGKRKRLAITDPEGQQEWLKRKLEQAGTQPLSAHLLREDWLKPRKEKHAITLYSATFEGRLRVLEQDTLLETLRDGIGRAKGFGMGLLSLAPAY